MKRATSTLAVAKAAWMTAFQDLVVADEPSQAGRIKWADATHLYNSNYTPAEAAERYLSALRNS